MIPAFVLATCVTAAGGEALITGKGDPRLASFDQLMTSFIAQKGCPGAGAAVGRRGRVVYSRGFGYADREKKTPVEPTSLFRIASISKPITATAVLQLAERGKLNLDDRVFGILRHEPHLEKGADPDDRLDDITIRHLLYHAGGWDREASFDPMFMSVRFAQWLDIEPPAGPDAIIRCMMGLPLDFDPGERYAYSNFGYCLLGRVIEEVSGRSYEDYVRQEVLKPLGIRDMRLGKTRLPGRAAGEVKYYDSGGRKGRSVFSSRPDEEVPLPYGTWCLEAMDAHGGWLASAEDLVKFACAFDVPSGCKILSPESIELMFAPPPGPLGHKPDGSVKDVYYACGWRVRRVGREGKINAWHCGALAGTSAILVRRHDGLNWAVLFNSRRAKGAERDLAGQIDGPMHQAANAVEEWPERKQPRGARE